MASCGTISSTNNTNAVNANDVYNYVSSTGTTSNKITASDSSNEVICNTGSLGGIILENNSSQALNVYMQTGATSSTMSMLALGQPTMCMAA